MNDDSTELPAALRARLASSPLWAFACALYARPGVEAACLRLQDDAGVDVCELLWRCWLFHHGLADAGPPEALEEMHRWQGEVTRPLRRLRRDLKPEACRHPDIAELRRTLMKAELQAERRALDGLEHATLAGPCRPLPSPPPPAEKYLAISLQLQKKSHLLPLSTLGTFLDPSQPPR